MDIHYKDPHCKHPIKDISCLPVNLNMSVFASVSLFLSHIMPPF